jgi:chromosome segregation ATPase
LSQHLDQQLERARQEEQILREQGILQAGEATAADALARLAGELQEIERGVTEASNSLEETNRQHAETRAALGQAQRDCSTIKNEQDRAQETWDRAIAVRTALEADATILRLLQTDEVDMDAAATGATIKATDELRRVTDAILRIGVEAAEDERAIHELGESGLLPLARDVESLLDWLRQRKVACWSGWKYIEENVSTHDRRALVQRLPHVVAGVLVASSDYERLGDLFAAGNGGFAYRFHSPLVIAPVDAITDRQGIPWMVVGPTSDAHFDKDAGGRELARLLGHKSCRQKEIDQYQEWREALVTLKLRLQQYQINHPRGWFSDRRQKLEILASRLEEATQSADRFAKRQVELEGNAEEIRVQIQTLSKSRSQKERHRDRLEQFDRSFGSRLDAWKSDLELARDRATKSRLRQETLKQEASENEDKAEQSIRQAEGSAQLASRLEAELSQVKYGEGSARQPEAGATEELRSRYQLLLADYEGKVNADSLSHRATDKDQAAERDMREFRRVMQQFPDIRDDAVEAELQKLPEGLSAQEQLERADEDYDAAWRKLGPLTNRRDAVAGEYESARKGCDELAKTAPLLAISEADSAEGHAARAVAARREADEQAELAKAFDAEVAKITDGLTKTTHEMEKIKKDQDRLESIHLNYQQQFDRLAAVTQGISVSEALPSLTVKDSETLAGRIGELERRLGGIREKHETLDEHRNKLAKEIADWSHEERFGKLRSSVSYRFVNREVSSLETKAEFDIGQLDDYVFQIEEKLKEADKQRELVVHVLSTAVDEALGLLARVSRMSKLPDHLPQAGKQFVKIETKASDNPAERRGHVGELIDELLERGDVGDGLQLIQKAVRRVARRITARVLHPDLHQKTDRVSIADMRRFSGGERLTSAILLFCALLRLRQGESHRRNGSSVLVLDNPIGTASRLSFLEMQREVASAMNVQLIYATAVNDLNAVGALENVIRLRNMRADRRTGRQFIEVDRTANGVSREVDAVRIVFDAAPSSMNGSNGSPGGQERQTAESKVSDEERPA